MAANILEKESLVWLADRHEDVAKAEAAILKAGGDARRPLLLVGQTGGVQNCLHPDVIEMWQNKGYAYIPGYCKTRCQRKGRFGDCPYLDSIKEAMEAQILVATKAFASRPVFFFENKRTIIVLDEDPIDLLRPERVLTREELVRFVVLCERIDAALSRRGDARGSKEAAWIKKLALWCLEQMKRQPLAASNDAQPEAVPVPMMEDRPGGDSVEKAFWRAMCKDPKETIRNIYQDLIYLVEAAASETVYFTSESMAFHLEVEVPSDCEVYILDATANVELLEAIFAPRPVKVECGFKVKPQGRIIQFMDFNGPRKYLDGVKPRVVSIIDAIGDMHRSGAIVLVSHKSCVEKLKQASRHRDRIRTAYYGALRGRNDLEPGPDNRIACHIVAGSPKTTEEDRRRLALAVYGSSILPFPQLQDVRRHLVGAVPAELAQDADAPERQVWEVKLKGYDDPRMQAVYDHTVVAELTHAADRARVLIHEGSIVYLLTNEPCPQLWFAEHCHADEYLGLDSRRADFEEAYDAYETAAKKLLNDGSCIGNADICRALGRKPGWGVRYWKELLSRLQDALTGTTRKVRWRDQG